MAKILVVDDDHSIRNMILAVLASKGHETLEADNGVTALELIKQHLPDLIISDVMMTNMNGFMLREILQEERLTSRIPVILMTGMAKEAGAWESDPSVQYLLKPFTIAALIALTEKNLSARSDR